MKIFSKKRVIWGIVILVVAGIGTLIYFSGKKNAAANITTDTVKSQNLEQTVLATGQVVSSIDLDLSFQTGGVIKNVMVKEGDQVKSGQTLAVLDQSNARASLLGAQGSLAQAQANYQKVLAGASSEAISVAEKAVQSAQVALDNANTNLSSTQAQQGTAVSNAYSALLNSTIVAIPSSNNLDTVSLTITGAYTGANQGSYAINLYNTNNGLRFQTIGLETADGNVGTVPVPMGAKGLSIQFNGKPLTSDTWTVNIPNTSASNYIANNNAYQTALKTHDSAISTAQSQVGSAQAALAQSQANLDQQRAAARPADIAFAKAQILSAEGQVASASAAYNNTILTAPANGTITQVDTKVGEQATPMQEVMVLQNVGDLHAEADVSEANVASLSLGQSVDYTFDALGPDRHFSGVIKTINPASTLVSGVVDYKVTASMDNVPDIKPGMTANMTILVAKRDNVLAVQNSAIINQDGKQYIRVVDNSQTKTYHQVEVQTGLQADGGLVEITSGLTEGQEIVTYIKP